MVAFDRYTFHKGVSHVTPHPPNSSFSNSQVFECKNKRNNRWQPDKYSWMVPLNIPNSSVRCKHESFTWSAAHSRTIVWCVWEEMLRNNRIKWPVCYLAESRKLELLLLQSVLEEHHDWSLLFLTANINLLLDCDHNHRVGVHGLAWKSKGKWN